MAAITRFLTLVPQRSAADRPARVQAPARPYPREAFSLGSDDCLVNAAVKNALFKEPELAHAGIHVSTSRGVVQLSGFVETRKLMAHAAAVARSVQGVKSVCNDMRRR